MIKSETYMGKEPGKGNKKPAINPVFWETPKRKD
jgi:hypothetical protein